MHDLHVTMVTGMAAGLAGLLDARMSELGHATVRYRQSGTSLTRAYDGERVTVPTGHCVSRTLRDDLPRFLADVVGRHDRLVLALPETVDPLDAATAIDAAGLAVRIDTVAMIADLCTLADELAGGDALADRGLAGAATDNRTVASVLARQAETADLFLTWAPPGADPEQAGIGRALLSHLSPWARFLDFDAASDITTLGGKPAFDLNAVHERMQPGGALPGCPEPLGAVSTLIWRSHRPFHPERLHHALETILDAGVRRARGHIWPANRPLLLLSWESAGETLTIDPAGRWPHGADDATWRRASPIRRTAASMVWHPEHGDRRSEIRFTGHDVAVEKLCSALDRAVLTGPEMARGERAWARFPDPFARSLGASAAEPDTRQAS